MPTECTPRQFAFEEVEGKAVVASFDGGEITSNAGALLLGQVDRRSMRAGIAVIWLDFSNTASWPSTNRLLVAKADTRWSALWPVRRL